LHGLPPVREALPVDIDFGDVSVAMRNFLRKQDKKRFSPGTVAAMTYLNLKDPATIKVMRGVMMNFGFKAQRLAHKAAKAIGLIQDSRTHPAATVGAPTVKTQIIHFLNRPMPGNLPKRTSRALLDIEDDKVIPVIRNPRKTTEESDAVFYFPGCGSERCSRRWDWPRRPCFMKWVRPRCCRRATCAAAIRRLLRATTTRVRRSRRITACCSTGLPTP
jgi:Fe-S oxidoreductase